MRVSNLPRRLAQIVRYARLAHTSNDVAPLIALGVARHHPFNEGDLLGRLGHKLYPQLSFRLAQLGGMRFSLDPADRDHMIIFEEVVLPHAYDAKLPFKPDAIFDCGGHIGLFSLTAAHQYPDVPLTIFEPNPRNLIYLRRNLELNSLNVTIIDAAVSIADGEDWFEDVASSRGQLSSSGPPTQVFENDRHDKFKVRVIDFPAYFKKQNCQAPLIKIDIEGEEMRVIPALVDLLPRTSAVFFETHRGEPGWHEIEELFSSRGFTVERRKVWKHCSDGLAIRN